MFAFIVDWVVLFTHFEVSNLFKDDINTWCWWRQNHNFHKSHTSQSKITQKIIRFGKLSFIYEQVGHVSPPHKLNAMYLYVCVFFTLSFSLCVQVCICVFDFSIFISAWFAFFFVCDGFYLILDVGSLYIDFCAFPAFWHLDSWMLESSMCYFHGSVFYLYEQYILIRWMHLCTDLSAFRLVFTPSNRSISLWIDAIKSRNDVSKRFTIMENWNFVVFWL